MDADLFGWRERVVSTFLRDGLIFIEAMFFMFDPYSILVEEYTYHMNVISVIYTVPGFKLCRI